MIKLRKWFTKHSKELGSTGIGALLGGLSFGPLGAIAGAGAGFALSTDKAKLWLFGDGKKNEGAISKIKKWFTKHSQKLLGTGAGAIAR